MTPRDTADSTHRRMDMNRKILVSLAGAALLGLAGLTAHAEGGNPPPGGPHFERGPGFAGDFLPPDLMGFGPGLLGRLADKLNLTQSQRDTIKGYMESARP